MNATFRWTANYALGVGEIDREHQHLFALAEEMHQAMMAGKGKQIVMHLLDEMLAYTGQHFAHEEELMERSGFPDREPHLRQHEELRTQVRAKRARALAGEVTMTIEAMQFLMSWLKGHILASDCRIADFLRQQETALRRPL